MIEFTGNSSDFLKIGVAAAARGDIERVREILKARPKWIRRVGSHGRTMLWEASHRGKLEMVKYLVRRKADINACGTHYTPYFVEVSCYCISRYKKHDDVAAYLLEKKAKLDIHTAAFLGDIVGIRKFLRRNPKLLNAGHPQFVMGKSGSGPSFVLAPAPWATPLCYALRGGTLESVEYLIKRGAKIKGNEQSLFNAADDDYEKVRLLLEHGADPNLGPTVFEDEGKLHELVSAYGVKSAHSAEASEELVYLCRGDRGGNPNEVKRFLKLGADVNFQDHKGKTALHRAAKSGFLEAMNILLKHGADVDAEDPGGETPLFDAIRSTIKNKENKKQAILLLLESSADPNHENGKGKTPVNVCRDSKLSGSKSLLSILKRYC